MNLVAPTRRTLIALVAALGLVVAAPPSAVDANHRPRGPELTLLTVFGSGLGSGSTIGADGALYVTDGNAGSVLRVDRKTGAVSTYASGLPLQRLGIGGAMDVAFIGHTAYVLVTLVGGDIVGGPPIGDDTVGIYRLERDGSFTVIADIGTWSIDHPPATDFFITTGVQYALETFRGGLLVTDGHHNRVLKVTRDGEISELRTLGNVVPTGLETSGHDVYVAETGPIPHLSDDGRVIAFNRRSSTTHEVVRGASMIVDVELGHRRTLFALSQGDWDGVSEGSPALANTGRLVEVGRDGGLRPIVDSMGDEIVLDRPTSMEFVGSTAYVISLTGAVYTINNVDPDR